MLTQARRCRFPRFLARYPELTRNSNAAAAMDAEAGDATSVDGVSYARVTAAVGAQDDGNAMQMDDEDEEDDMRSDNDIIGAYAKQFYRSYVTSYRAVAQCLQL